MASTIGLSVRPRGASEYSTFGGTCANTFRRTRPSASISRSCWISIFCVHPPTARLSSENRYGRSNSRYRMRTFHRPPITASVDSAGQWLAWYFIRLAVVSVSPLYPLVDRRHSHAPIIRPKEHALMTHNNRIAELIAAPADATDPVEGAGLPRDQDVLNTDASLLDAYSRAVTRAVQ